MPEDKLAPADEPWRLIRDALQDLREQQKQPSVVIDMKYWHMSTFNKDGQLRCVQCFAGSVMSESLGVSVGVTRHPPDMGEYKERLFALNFFRTGSVVGGLVRLGYKVDDLIAAGVPEYADVVPWSDATAENFYRDMNAMADMLEDKLGGGRE